MTYTNFHANINDNIINALHEEGYPSANYEDAFLIVSNFYKGKGALGAHRIDGGNKGVSVWMTEGKNRDSSLVLHISDFKSGGLYKCKNVWRGEYPKRDGSFKDCEKVLSLNDFTYPSSDEWRDEGSLPNKLIDKLKKKVPLINEYALRDVENSPVVIAYKDGLCRVLARSLSIDGLFRGELSFCEEKFSGMWPNRDQWAKNSCGKIKDDSGAYLHGGIFVICGEILSSKHAILCEGLATSLTAQIAIERTAALLEMGICVVFAQGHANLDATDKTLRRISPDIRVFYHDEGSGLSLSCVGISSLLSRDKNHDWNDDIHKMISDGASVEEAYQRLGKHILDGMNSSLALKEEEKPEKEVEGYVTPEDFIENISLNLSVLPICLSKILSDVSGFNEESQPSGLSSLLCFIGGVIGHRVRRGNELERPFLYMASIGKIGSGKTRRFKLLRENVFDGAFKRFFLEEFVETKVNRFLVGYCDQIYRNLLASRRGGGNTICQDTFCIEFIKKVNTETLWNVLYQNPDEESRFFKSYSYAESCVIETYKQLFDNKKELIARGIARGGDEVSVDSVFPQEISQIANGFSSLALNKIVGKSVKSEVMINLLTLSCPSFCFYYDELLELLSDDHRTSEKIAFQSAYLLSIYDGGSSSDNMSHGSANIINNISPAIFMYGNLTTENFYSSCIKGKFFESLNRNGFLGRLVLCEDKAPPVSVEKIYQGKDMDSHNKNKAAFRELSTVLVAIENSFQNPVEFLLGHIRIPLFHDAFIEKAISCVSLWASVYRDRANDFDEGSVGRDLLISFTPRLHANFNSIYSLMVLLFAGEELNKGKIPTLFSSLDPFDENFIEHVKECFLAGEKLHTFVQEDVLRRAAKAAENIFNVLIKADFEVRCQIAFKSNPYKSVEMECARSIYRRIVDENNDWSFPIIVRVGGLKIATRYIDPKRMASSCSWLRIPDKKGSSFFHSAIANKEVVLDFFNRHSVSSNEYSLSKVAQNLILDKLGAQEDDGKMFVRIKLTFGPVGGKTIEKEVYVFNFFNKQLVIEELCKRGFLPIRYGNDQDCDELEERPEKKVRVLKQAKRLR